MLVAVYGTLRDGQSNHKKFLSNSDYIGDWESDPLYSMYSLGGFPGIKKGGGSSIVFEIYEIDDIQLQEIDTLEGYNKDKPDKGLYKRELIHTPYGEAYTYFYNGSPVPDSFIETGDWVEYYEIQKIIRQDA